jgi:hypothetical protein
MTDIEVEEIRLGAVLHDIGKVGIPENILNKSGPLNPDEWETMKSHVQFGAKILEPLTPLARIREMVLHHHEFFDGSGYPEGLVGEKIPLGARIIAVADAYDTITSDRTYKKSRFAAEALSELRAHPAPAPQPHHRSHCFPHHLTPSSSPALGYLFLIPVRSGPVRASQHFVAPIPVAWSSIVISPRSPGCPAPQVLSIFLA